MTNLSFGTGQLLTDFDFATPTKCTNVSAGEFASHRYSAPERCRLLVQHPFISLFIEDSRTKPELGELVPQI